MNPRSLLISALLLFVVLITAACGSSSDSGSAEFARITPSETLYELNDLLEIGFKKGKTFDVEGLTAATHAYYGFWGLDPYEHNEFEARFYSSHSDAVEFGTSFADERTGEDALIKSGKTSWEEGAKEARTCYGNCKFSKYGDYVIYGNMILICQGRNSLTSLENCTALLRKLVPNAG